MYSMCPCIYINSHDRLTEFSTGILKTHVWKHVLSDYEHYEVIK